ncbi:hypothetical protein pb186bvf_009220 [Paramecium bursaria]
MVYQLIDIQKAIIQTAYTIKSFFIKALHLDRDIINYLIEASIKQIDLIENFPKPLEYTKLEFHNCYVIEVISQLDSKAEKQSDQNKYQRHIISL